MKIILTAQEVKQILENHVNNTLGVTASVFETEDVVLEVGKPSKSTLDLLKEQADNLGIQYRNTIGEDALRKKIEEHLQPVDTEDDLIETVLPKEDSIEDISEDSEEEEEIEKPRTSLFNKAEEEEEESEDDEEPKVKRGGIFGNRNA